jgi:peptidoglycan hydrolase-like amidase
VSKQLQPGSSRCFSICSIPTTATVQLGIRWSAVWRGLATTACLVGLTSLPAVAQAGSNPTSKVLEEFSQAQSTPQPQNPSQSSADPALNVGIVQRFGSEAGDEIILQPLTGDRLTLQFETGGQMQTVTANTVKLEIMMEPLAEPQVNERVVLSTHRSFESAEDSANQWRSRGIEVEIAQPRQWQVWAKRDVYRSPLLRRLLFQNLQANGSKSAFLDTQMQQQLPKAAFVANGYRYQRDQVKITTANRRVQVTPSRSDSERRLYGGNLRLQPNAYGTYTLVNEVPIETYLRGVVPHEIGVGAPPTTIEAQAILARTYALRNLRRFAIDNYELCADTQCQVYRGLSGAHPETDRAIAATRSQVLTYQNELVDALYSSTTGGITAPFSDVWNGPDRPYLRAVVDSVQNIWDLSRYSLADEANLRTFIGRTEGFNENGWDVFRWRVESPMTQITADLKEYLTGIQHPLANFTTVQQVQVVERSPAGRVQRMAVQTDRGTVELEKDEILRAFYAPNSTLFYMDPIYEAAPGITSGAQVPTEEPSVQGAQNSQPAESRILKGYVFVGGGLGHGVGMSQTGAYNLGDLGWSNAQILNFYYPGTQLQPLSDAITFWRDPAVPQDLPDAGAESSTPAQ